VGCEFLQPHGEGFPKWLKRACLFTGESKNGGASRMYAIIKTGGKQYRVSEGTVLKIEKVPGEKGDKVSFSEVLLISADDGALKVGDPLVAGAVVTGEICEQGKEKKVVVYKYKKRKNYRRKQGHRQPFTRIKIDKIVVE
jgi:large subunit ribosomal protein L21